MNTKYLLRIDKELWRQAKMRAAELEKPMSKIIEMLIRKWLRGKVRK